MKLVHFADLHLDASFTWLGPSGGSLRRQGLRNTLRRIVDLAVSEGADALLCGGDLYEHERFTPDTEEFIRGEFARAHPIPVFISPGNHDWHGPQSLYAKVKWSPNVHIFWEDRLSPIELSEGLALWGAGHRAPANTGNFLNGFTVDRGGVNVALFHGAERGSLWMQGEGKKPHAAFDEDEIAAAGLLHAFVGHYHQPRQTASLTYPGNPDPLEFGETGERGAVIAEIDGSGVRSRRVVQVASASVTDCPVDVTDCSSQQEVIDRISEALQEHRGFVRVKVEGEVATSVSLDRTVILNSLADSGRVQLQLAVRPAYDLDALVGEATVRGQFIRDVRESGLNEDEKLRVIITGLRALDGRGDLEVAQ